VNQGALGRLLGTRHGKETRENFRRGCELGDPEGCEALAFLEENSEIIDGRKTAVDEAFARACRGGRPGSCHRLALRWLEDAAAQERSMALLIDNCNRGYTPSCNVAAIRYAPLLSPVTSCERVLPFAERSCATDDSLGCALADAYHMTTPANRAAALERLRSACETDQPLACLYWSDAEEGDPARDDQQVRRAYGMACQRRDSPGFWLGCARAEAHDLAHATSHIEVDSAISHLRDQCVAGSAPACCILAGEYQSGTWMPADPVRSIELRKRGCVLGDRRCCDKDTY
jgi:TPR repeat protein